MTAALEGGEWSAARPGRTLPPGKTRYPFYRRLCGPQGRSERSENLVPTGIRSPDLSARSSVAIPTELPGPLIKLLVNRKPETMYICTYVYMRVYRIKSLFYQVYYVFRCALLRNTSAILQVLTAHRLDSDKQC